MKPLDLMKKSLTYLTPVLLATPALAKEAAAEVVKQTAEEANQPSTLYRMFASPWFIPVTLPIFAFFIIYGQKIGMFIGFLGSKLTGKFEGSFQDLLDIDARAKELLRTGQAADDDEALGMAGIERFPELQGERLAEAWEVLGRHDKARSVREERARNGSQAQGNQNTFTPGFTAGNNTSAAEAQPGSSNEVRHTGPSQKKHTRRGGGIVNKSAPKP